MCCSWKTSTVISQICIINIVLNLTCLKLTPWSCSFWRISSPFSVKSAAHFGITTFNKYWYASSTSLLFCKWMKVRKTSTCLLKRSTQEPIAVLCRHWEEGKSCILFMEPSIITSIPSRPAIRENASSYISVNQCKIVEAPGLRGFGYFFTNSGLNNLNKIEPRPEGGSLVEKH